MRYRRSVIERGDREGYVCVWGGGGGVRGVTRQ